MRIIKQLKPQHEGVMATEPFDMLIDRRYFHKFCEILLQVGDHLSNVAAMISTVFPTCISHVDLGGRIWDDIKYKVSAFNTNHPAHFSYRASAHHPLKGK